jgi:hypothetical protein
MEKVDKKLHKPLTTLQPKPPTSKPTEHTLEPHILEHSSSSVSHPHKTLKKERGGREGRKERRSYSFTSFPEGDKQWSEKRQKDRRKLGP